MRARILMVLLALIMAAGCDPYKEGRELMAQGNYSDAADYFYAQSKKHPDDYRAFHELGFCYTRLRLNRSALESYHKALELKPGYAPTLLNIGTLYYYLREYNKSAYYLEKAVEADPENVTAHLNLGTTYAMLRKYQEAIDQVEKARELSGGKDDFADELAKLREEWDKWKPIEEWLETPGMDMPGKQSPVETEGQDQVSQPPSP